MPLVRQGGFAGNKPLNEIIVELLQAKRNANRRPIYINLLGQCLRRLAVQFRYLEEINQEQIEKWLARYQSANSKQTWLNRISTLYSYAIRKGYARENPCTRIERISIDRCQPAILTVEQSRALLATCPPICKPFLIIGMFAGVRPDEIMRLDWRDVCLDTKTINVSGKTRRRRIVPLEPIAAELISPFKKESGPVAPAFITVRRWRRSARNLIGGKWTPDILRHTAASYLLALHQDAGKVSFMLGNSSKILLQHYHSPVKKEDMERFWKL